MKSEFVIGPIVRDDRRFLVILGRDTEHRFAWRLEELIARPDGPSKTVGRWTGENSFTTPEAAYVAARSQLRRMVKTGQTA